MITPEQVTWIVHCKDRPHPLPDVRESTNIVEAAIKIEKVRLTSHLTFEILRFNRSPDELARRVLESCFKNLVEEMLQAGFSLPTHPTEFTQRQQWMRSNTTSKFMERQYAYSEMLEYEIERLKQEVARLKEENLKLGDSLTTQYMENDID